MARLRRMAAGTSSRRLFMSTTSAASMATSVPAPMAMPVSARVRAGASLMPSPTMATLPCSFRRRITASLPSGRTPAMTSSTPACAPMAFAVRSLSPVSMTTRMPMPCSSRTACGLSGLMMSATAITPRSLPLRQKNSGVLPCSASRAARSCVSCGIAARLCAKARLPPASFCPSSSAVRPLPGSARKFVTSGASIPAARRTTARASGCSLRCSSALASRSSSSSVTPGAGSRSVTSGSPCGMVPVLSRATIAKRPS